MHRVQIKRRTFELLPYAKYEFIDNHKEWDFEMITNDKIVYEALRYYIGTGFQKNLLLKLGDDRDRK